MNNIFITISAPSGTGKNTIINKLLGEMSDLQFARSATTRSMRDGDTEDSYYFLTPTAFRKKIDENGLFEWEEVYKDLYYGVLKEEVNSIWSTSKNAISDVDFVGALNIKKELGEKALAVFVLPPSLDELERRLRERGTESEERIKERMVKAEKEIAEKGKFDAIVINDNLDIAVAEIKKIIEDYYEKINK